eukprot:sb/3473071/
MRNGHKIGCTPNREQYHVSADIVSGSTANEVFSPVRMKYIKTSRKCNPKQISTMVDHGPFTKEEFKKTALLADSVEDLDLGVIMREVESVCKEVGLEINRAKKSFMVEGMVYQTPVLMHIRIVRIKVRIVRIKVRIVRIKVRIVRIKVRIVRIKSG